MGAEQEQNKAAVRRMIDATNTRDGEHISVMFDELFAAGAGAFTEVFATLHRAFPDLHITVEDLIAEDDKVVARHTVAGTNLGEYLGRPPTGNRVTYAEVFILRFAGGRVVETWGIVDTTAQRKQLDQ